MVTALVWEKSSDYKVDVVDQDGLWKKVIGDLFEDFLLFFKPALHSQVDFTKEAEFLQQELFQKIMDKKKGRQWADQLVKVHSRLNSTTLILARSCTTRILIVSLAIMTMKSWRNRISSSAKLSLRQNI
ncbi:hypothetical protein MHZ95_12600 [Sporosarcina sp. ACRSM]|uniref:hypothetical protein n=1 Tax=Sporosarcina sp. ACRSM TaxID=2918216 RepID=UPI001EF428ED|nr:hypothetical protein [Sporosarcina sp. ACRSM]MCG7336104.1 hypothetical protein [Sporosarcina sp. ACRSM]